MNKQIKITCKGQDYKPLDELVNFQGNLKTLPRLLHFSH